MATLDELLAFEPRLFGLALRLSGSHHTAEDLVQETYVKAIAALPGYREQAPPWHWLARILVNTWRNSLRRPDAEPLPSEVCALPRVLAELAGDELSLKLEQALQRLSPMQRAAILLRSREQFSYAEIATALGTSLEAVKVHLHQARKRLSDACGA